MEIEGFPADLRRSKTIEEVYQVFRPKGGQAPSGDSGAGRTAEAAPPLHELLYGPAHVSRALDDLDARGGQRGHLLGRRALAARDDRARVSHPASRRRRLAGDEADDRLLEVRFDP